MTVLLALLGCSGGDDDASTVPAPLDLSLPLNPGEVRAGVVTDERALFGGIAAEGRVGDVKIYNDRVRFVIQGVREGSFYMPQAGAVIDADIVRPLGQPGHDMVDEWHRVYGLGLLLDATSIEVVADGTDGEAAIVRVRGIESPLHLIQGALGQDSFVPIGLDIEVDYILPPDSNLLEVKSTVKALDADATFSPGDVIIGSLDAAEAWEPGVGLEGPDGRERTFAGYVGQRNELAFGVVAPPGETTEPGGLQAFQFLLDIAGAFKPEITVKKGETATWSAFYGVARDVATLTDTAIEGDVVKGVVEAPDGPVAGARVNVLVDDEPYTLAFTDASGAFRAEVPSGADARVLATGRGPALYLDEKAGSGLWSPYAADAVKTDVLASIADGTSRPLTAAEGRGVASADDPLALGEPGWLELAVDDGLPFAVQVHFVDPDPGVDSRLSQERPSGRAALGWSRDGDLRIPLEPGTYRVVAHRGVRFELHEETIVVEASETVTRELSLPAAYDHTGWVFGDPHVHAAPSPDGHIPMEDRLVVQAANGVQLHFGTDHDHVASYRPLIGALGLSGVIETVVATEVSSVLRGHKNAYPLLEADLPNNGASRWWMEPSETTEAEVASLRQRWGNDFVLQINHPVGIGMADIAQWIPGRIQSPDFWADDFDAMEVINGGSYDDYLPVYLDLQTRGHRVVPTGVSDSHRHLSGEQGVNGTWIAMDGVAGYSDAALVASFRAGRTVATLGPFLALSTPPGSVVGPTLLDVEARTPSWFSVDRLVLYRDGEVEQVVEGTSARFDLSPKTDAVYNVVAEGDTPMQPLTSKRPWAIAHGVFVDVDGDGWEPPKRAMKFGPL